MAPHRQLALSNRGLDATATRIVRRLPHVITARQGEIDAAAARLALLDPVNLLRRGWSITRSADGSVLRSVADARAGELITTQVADGSLSSRIEES